MRRLLPAIFLFLTACANSTPSSAPRSIETPPPASSIPPSTSEPATPRPEPASKPERPRLRRCRYAFPVRPSTVADYGAAHHDYPATDIFAPVGTDFVAPTSGRVDYVSRTDRWDSSVDDPATRGGLSVAVVGEDGVRYYGSHLREVSPNVERGRRVRVGDKLGEIGNSGNARGVAPHLHFGISHPTHPTDWKVRRGEVSPFQYLNAWRNGDDVTPDVPGSDRPRCKPSE